MAQSTQRTSATPSSRPLLPEWRDLDVDDAAWIASIEASRREVFAELADL